MISRSGGVTVGTGAGRINLGKGGTIRAAFYLEPSFKSRVVGEGNGELRITDPGSGSGGRCGGRGIQNIGISGVSGIERTNIGSHLILIGMISRSGGIGIRTGTRSANLGKGGAISTPFYLETSFES